MKLLEDDLKCTQPMICEINKDYVKYMQGFDWRVSMKFNRKFVGLAIRINNRFYVVPLTSQTTAERVARGKKKRSADITTFIKVGGKEIANLLHNNMFPVPRNQIRRIEIDPLVDTYLANEHRQIRKNWVDINTKSMSVYRNRNDMQAQNYQFLEKTCCDFKKLETACDDWEKNH